MARPQAGTISAQPLYTIGVAARLLGVTVHTLRQYEAEGLILPAKTETHRRLYSDLEIEKVRCIKSMIRDQGLNFEGIRNMLALIPCWKIKGCRGTQKASCRYFQRRNTPCWASQESCCSRRGGSCRECPVYRSVTHCDDLKRLLFDDR